MVSSEVVNFRIPKALYDKGQAVVETGGAVSQSDLVALAVSGQIGEDLGAYQRQATFAVSESRTGYAKGKGAESMQVSVRLSTDSKRRQRSPPSKHGQILCRHLADRALNLLSHPLIRRALYYLLWVCLVVEEYLIRILLEEG